MGPIASVDNTFHSEISGQKSLPGDKTLFQVEIKHAVAIGSCKADVLERVAGTGLPAEAGRSLGMSHQRVWLLVAKIHSPIEHAVSKRLPLLVGLIRPEAGTGR